MYGFKTNNFVQNIYVCLSASLSVGDEFTSYNVVQNGLYSTCRIYVAVGFYLFSLAPCVDSSDIYRLSLLSKYQQ